MTASAQRQIALLALGAALLAPVELQANDDTDKSLSFETLVDLGFGFVDEDGFVLLLLEQGLAYEGLDIRVQGPLRFRVVDRSPGDDGVVREQDWDEVSDYARILRTVSFRNEWEDAAVDLYFGELNGVGIGHGSVADAYFNSVDMDHYKGGLLLKGEWRGNGLEFLMEDALGPEIIAGRVFIAPIAWFVDGDWPRRLELGYTLGADISAPLRVFGEGETVLPTTGGDISFRVVDVERFVLMPYVDLMAMDGELGVHAGMAMNWSISEKNGVNWLLRGEYRYVGSDYHPTLFNPFYEHNRRYFEIDEPGETPTLADHLTDYDDLPVRHGTMFDTAIEWTGGLRFGARYDTEGTDRPHWVLFRLEVFPWDGYNFAAFYGGQDVNGGTRLFDLDSLIGVAMRARIWGPIDFFGEFTRRFRRHGGNMPYANETGAGIGLSFRY